MKHIERFQKALESRQPGQSLRLLAKELTSEGQTKEQVYSHFEAFLLEIRKLPGISEEKEDAVLDVMDAVTGWCHSNGLVLPERESQR